jgi:hypothetical protein
MGGTTWAKHHKNAPATGKDQTIIEISPMSVTVDAGNDVQQTYAITGTTKATLDGNPVNVDDLKAGMVAAFTLTPDNQSVVTLAAKNAPRVTKKPVVHHDGVWVNLH